MQTIRIKNEPVYLKNKNFQTIQIQILFPFEETEEEIAKMTLLSSMLVYMNEAYPTEELFQRERKRRYLLNRSCGKIIIGTTGYFSFLFTIPDPKALGINYLEKQLEFIGQIIYHPKVVNQGFDPFELEREKKGLQLGIQNGAKHLKTYQSIHVVEKVDDQGILSRCIENHQEQIQEVTPQNLYQYYLKQIAQNTPIVVIMGNVSKKEMNPLLYQYIIPKNASQKMLEIPKHYTYYLQPTKKEVHVIEEKSEFKDSSISFIYKIQDMTEKDSIYLGLIKRLLTSLSSRMLNKKLRDEGDLVYASKVVSYSHFGVFEITAYIQANKRKQVEEKISEVMEELRDISIIESYLENIKNRMRVQLIRSLDDKADILADFVMNLLEIKKNSEKNYAIIQQVTAQDIVHFMDRVCLDTIYFIEEGDHV